MNRRNFMSVLAGASAMALSGLALAQETANLPGLPPLPGMPTATTVVVEIGNFGCDRCRTINDHFPRLKRIAAENGVELRFAPLAWKGQSMWPDRVFYATRDLYPAAEHFVRDAMFEGIQREGMMFENLPQVLAYLERRQIPQRALQFDKGFSLVKVAERANTDDVMYSEMKAGRLVSDLGATEVPVFVWVRNGEIIKVVSTNESKDPLVLTQIVQRELTAASAEKEKK